MTDRPKAVHASPAWPLRPTLGLVLGVAIAVPIFVACDEEFKTCYPGDYVACHCANDGVGYAACSPKGDDASARCVCDGTTPGIDASVVDAGDASEGDSNENACVPADGDGGDAGLKKYFEVCASNAACETCRCEDFAGRRVCTKSCASLAECPAPSDACTNRGVCRPPP